MALVASYLSEKMDGFEETIQACKELGLDLSEIPRPILRIFYDSGKAYHNQETLTPEQKGVWIRSIRKSKSVKITLKKKL